MGGFITFVWYIKHILVALILTHGIYYFPKTSIFPQNYKEGNDYRVFWEVITSLNLINKTVVVAFTYSSIFQNLLLSRIVWY